MRLQYHDFFTNLNFLSLMCHSSETVQYMHFFTFTTFTLCYYTIIVNEMNIGNKIAVTPRFDITKANQIVKLLCRHKEPTLLLHYYIVNINHDWWKVSLCLRKGRDVVCEVWQTQPTEINKLEESN